MKYFKSIDLPWLLASLELKNYIFSKFDVSNCVSWTRTNLQDVLLNCPSLTNIANNLKTKITYVAFVVYHKNDQSVIHIDADSVNKSRLILPVLNCEDSETCFYTTKSLPKIRTQPNGVPFYHYKKEECILTDKFNLNNGLFLFRIKEPHCVVMPLDKTTFPRISCTFATAKDLTGLLD